jgi:hypothetical protein
VNLPSCYKYVPNSFFFDTFADANEEDTDITPKASKFTSRTASAGVFLKEELHRRSFDIEAGRYSVRGSRHAICPPDEKRHSSTNPIKDSPPKLPERRPSKSKNLMLRAFGGRSSAEKKPPLRRSDSTMSTMSKVTLIRRLSRSRNKDSSSDHPADSGSATPSNGDVFEPRSFDIADVNVNSRPSSTYDYESPPSSSVSSISSSLPNRDIYVLSPRITITPEVSSIDNGVCTFWVGIEITGVLNKADDHGSQNQGLWRYPSQPITTQLSGMCNLEYHELLHPHCFFYRSQKLWPSAFNENRTPPWSRLPGLRNRWQSS